MLSPSAIDEGIGARIRGRGCSRVGHRNLQALQKYLEVSEEQVEVAISTLTFNPQIN